MAQLNVEEGDKVKLEYPVADVKFPEWRGPPKSKIITNDGDETGKINPEAPAASRLKYDQNNRDLILSNAVADDSGEYKCSSQGTDHYAITLKVNRRKHNDDGLSAPRRPVMIVGILVAVVAVVASGVGTYQVVKRTDRWTWWKILLVICFCCLMVLFVVGLILFYFLCLKDCNAENC